MTIYRHFFLVKTLALILVIAVSIYAKLFTYSVGSVFHPPEYSPYFTVSLLTNVFQILCTIPVILCLFSWALLRTIKPLNQTTNFLLISTILTGSFLLLEFFRLHVHLQKLGVPKVITAIILGIIAIGYGLIFWRVIQSTPYFLLLTSMGLMFIVVIVDSLKLRGDGIPSLLEGVPKLFSEINVVLYYWEFCFREVKRTMTNSVEG